MKKITFLIAFSLSIVTILFFRELELSTIESGFSWTLAKALPYALLIFIGFVLALLFPKLVSIKKKVLKLGVQLLLLVLPFSIGFALFPIYEGDFSLIGKELKQTKSLENFENADLVVIAIPGCPYCLASIDKLKLIKKRNPSIKIHFVVSTPDQKDLANYLAAAGGMIDVQQSKEIELTSEYAESRYPTFIQIKNNKAVYKWSNDQFGVRAVDKLEGELN